MSQAFEFAQKCSIADEALRNCLNRVETIKHQTKETQDESYKVRVNKSSDTEKQVQKIKDETEEDEAEYDTGTDLASSSGAKIKDESIDDDPDYLDDKAWNNKCSADVNNRTRAGKRKPTFCCKTCDTKFKVCLLFDVLRCYGDTGKA